MLGSMEILILVVLAAVAVKLYRHPPANLGKVLMPLLASVVVLMFVAVLIFRKQMSPSEPAAGRLFDLPAIEVLAPRATVWANMDQQQFLANVYPSREAAATPLARQVRDILDRRQLLNVVEAEVENAAGVEEVHAEADSIGDKPAAAKRLTAPAFLMLYDNSAGNDVLRKFSRFLQGEFPISEVRVDGHPFVSKGPPAPIENGGVRIVLTTDEEHIEVAVSDHSSRQIQGKLACEITTAKGTVTITADYIHKPWVENFDQFVSTQPNQHIVVGYSNELVSSEQEARQLALQHAQRTIRSTVPGRQSVTLDDSVVVDRFAQKLSRPYGDVWREAVLVDISSQRLGPLIEAAQQRTIAKEHEHFTLVAALGILFGVTVVLCVVLNLLTQGYYRGRVLVGVLVVAGIGLLVALA